MKVNNDDDTHTGRYRYRNKCEFTVGTDANGTMALGFRVSTFGDTINVQSPENCDNIPLPTKLFCKKFEHFLKTSTLPIYDVRNHKGVWRQLTVQHSRKTGDLRGIVQVKLENVDAAIWETELLRLKEWCENEKNGQSTKAINAEAGGGAGGEGGEGGEASGPTTSLLGVTGMLVSRYDGSSMPLENDPTAIPSLVWGVPDVREHLTVLAAESKVVAPTLTFVVSPGAFFQVNTPGCELLYSIVGRYARSTLKELQEPTVEWDGVMSVTSNEGDVKMVIETDETDETDGNKKMEEEIVKKEENDITILDVCCGTGTIGLCVAASNEQVKKVVGVELCEAAVKDARRNAELNNQGDTAHFFAAKAESM